MRFDGGKLQAKALLALEEAVQECRYRRPRRTFALRFALAWLWSQARCEREPFDALWRVLGDERSPWSFSAADGALLRIYRALGVERDEEMCHRMWILKAREEEGP